MRKTLAAYYAVTKPGIIRGNAVHVLAGALLASVSGVDWSVVIGVIIGTSFVIASACVANNYLDRGIDSKMKRTSGRPSVTGQIPLTHAVVYLLVLLAIGLAVLWATTNPIIIVIGVIAYVLYVFAYGYAKRRTVQSTLIGAIPGALPAMAGYVAVSGEVSLAAWLVFAVVFMWQMPHFYAISIFRKKEYKAAGVPVLGVARPFRTVRRYIFVYLLLYLVTVCGLIVGQVVGAPSGALLLAGAAYWMVTFIRTDTNDEVRWARMIFGSSLLLTLGLLAAAVLNVFVPPFV